MVTALPPALFDLEPVEAPTEQAVYRPTWSTITCHTCGQPLRRFVRQDPATGWYRYSIDHTAWDHMRAHHAGRSLITPWPYGLRHAVHEGVR